VRNRVLILAFHRVLAEADPFRPGDVTVDVFDMLCRSLRRYFNVLSLPQAVDRLEAGDVPGRAVVLTFDDGYADNVSRAAPVLQRYGLPATCFVATGFLDGSIMFNDQVIEALRTTRLERLELPALGLPPTDLSSVGARVAAVDTLLNAVKHLAPAARRDAVDALITALGTEPPPPLMMNRNQVRALARSGVEIGGHTHSHPILTAVPDATACSEIRQGRETLESILQREISSFAYPNGKPEHDYAASHVAAVRAAGFERAVTKAWGVAQPGDDRFQLPRITTWDRTALTFVPRMLAYYLRPAEGERVVA
jgi:peptidoglycan/xylan/chitin deacetylase (PgdA/CDA1 family)